MTTYPSPAITQLDTHGGRMVPKYTVPSHTTETRSMGDLPAIIVAELRRLLIDFSPKALAGAITASWACVVKEAPDYYIGSAAITWFLVGADTLLLFVLALRDRKFSWKLLGNPLYKLLVYTILSLAWLGISLGLHMTGTAAFTAGAALNTYFMANEFLSILNHSDNLTSGSLKIIDALKNVANAIQDKSQQVIQAVTDIFAPEKKAKNAETEAISIFKTPED